MELLRGRDGLPGVQGPVGPPGPRSGGAIYTRWGKSSCPQVEGTQIVYSGITGGTAWNQPGGGANYLCMPKVPEYSPTLRYRGGANGHSFMYATTEYHGPHHPVTTHPVPCATSPQDQLFL